MAAPAADVEAACAACEQRCRRSEALAALRRRSVSLIQDNTIAEGLTIALSEKTHRHTTWLANFNMVAAMTFAVQGILKAILDYAPIILPRDIVQVGTTVYRTTLALGCIVGAGPMVSRLGPRPALLAGTALIDVFCVLFLVCVALRHTIAVCWPVFMAGMVCLGIGNAIASTAICVYMTKVSAILAEESPSETEAQLSANLGGTMAAWALGLQVVFELATSSLQATSLPIQTVVIIWVAVAGLCTVLLALTRSLPPEHAKDSEPAGFAGKVGDFFKLWCEPSLWLLGFTNFTCAFSDALFTNYIAPVYVAPMLGSSAVGICSALTSLSGALLSKPNGFLAGRAGNGLAVGIAAVCFMLTPVLMMATGIATSGGWAIAILFILHGSGLSVQAGVNRAIYADFFAGPLVGAAFANWNFQNAIAEAVGSLLETAVTESALLWTCIALAALTLPCYFTAVWRRARQTSKKAHIGADGNGQVPSEESSESSSSASSSMA